MGSEGLLGALCAIGLRIQGFEFHDVGVEDFRVFANAISKGMCRDAC